jgi:hypothetical protein
MRDCCDGGVVMATDFRDRVEQRLSANIHSSHLHTLATSKIIIACNSKAARRIVVIVVLVIVTK